MTLKGRLQRLELKISLSATKPGCDISLFIVTPESSRNEQFDSETYRPANGELEKYIEILKQIGQCQGCKGSCAIDWSPEGFSNHTLLGDRNYSSLEPKIFTMFCADAETPGLMRRLQNGELTNSTPPIKP